MMKRFYIVSLLLLSINAYSQEASKPRTSPLAVVTAKYKGSYLKIVYSQPQKRGREIFGKLVPFDQVWSPGANEVPEVTITRDIKVNGSLLKAGTYSVFTIPKEGTWTVIFNSDLGLEGSYNYMSKSDVLRFDVPVVRANDFVYESFTIWIDQQNDKATISMAWDKTKASFNIQFLEPKP